MKKCSTTELREKEIINLCDGTRLGYADDFEFDLCDGHITALLLAGEKGMFCFTRGDELRIPWDKIECIGEDTILVRLNLSEPPYCEFVRKNMKKSKIL